MPTARPSATHPGVIRRQARRLVQLGIIRSMFEAPDASTYRVTTTGGDELELPRRDMPAYLRGLAQGAHAEAVRHG